MDNRVILEHIFMYMNIDVRSIRRLPPEEKIRSFGEMEAIIRKLRRAGTTVVLAQGVFDIVHSGHVGYLRASARIDPKNCFLIVGLENDETVKQNKGDGRPINPLDDRLHVISEFVSVGLAFAYEDTPHYDKPEDYIKRYSYLKAAAISVPSWDPHSELKQWQANQAGSQLAFVQYRHVNSTTKMLRKLGYE